MNCVTLNNGVLSISNEIKCIPQYCFSNNSTITHIQLNNVEVVSENAFSHSSTLIYVDGLRVKQIEDHGFYTCSLLKITNFPQLVELG